MSDLFKQFLSQTPKLTNEDNLELSDSFQGVFWMVKKFVIFHDLLLKQNGAR